MRLAAIALALLLPQQEDLDVVHLKDGTLRKGIISSETASSLVLETLIKGSKGQVVGSAKNTIQKSDVDRIERASEEARKKAGQRSAAFGERGVRRAEALARTKPEPAEVEGARGLRVAGAQFVLLSTCDVAFVKDAAVSLEELFTGYRKFFDIRRNSERKITVYLLSDRGEYERFQKRKHGAAFLNPAYYHVGENYIAAYNMVQRDEERRVRGEIRRLETEIEGFKMQISTAERQVDAAARDLRRNIADAAAERRRQVRGDGGAAKDARLREVDRWEREQQDLLRQKETEAQKELQDLRKKANETIDANRKVIDQNEKTLAGQNRSMFELLFHEGFHAFASNYLWEGSGQREFPRWLHEGMAGYFEMSAVEGGELVHGATHPEFLRTLREMAMLRTIMPLEKLLRGGPEAFSISHASEARRATAYYAQSWALAHYLSGRATRERLAAYVGEVLAGGDVVRAFEKLAGKPCAQVEKELQAHLDAMK